MSNDHLYNLVKNAFAAGLATGRAEANPEKDVISMKDASKIYGRKWLEDKMIEGKIFAHRSSDASNARYYLSHAEIKCVKNNEAICEIVVKDKYNIKN